jgi:hypothetical protein
MTHNIAKDPNLNYRNVYTPFSVTDHKNNDALGKKYAHDLMTNTLGAEYLFDNVHELTTFQDGKWDGAYLLNDKKIVIETEIKHSNVWGFFPNNPFPTLPFKVSTIQFLYRKVKDNKADKFFIFNPSGEFVFVIGREKLIQFAKENSPKLIPNHKQKEGTYIYQIPIELGKFARKKDEKYIGCKI